MKKAGTRVAGWSPRFFFLSGDGEGVIHPSRLQHLASAVGGDHPPPPTPRDPHLRPHR